MNRTQYEIENEYYFVDLPDLIEKKRKSEAMALLQKLRSDVAAGARSMGDEDYSKYSEELAKLAGLREEKQRFDREGFEQMKGILSSG